MGGAKGHQEQQNARGFGDVGGAICWSHLVDAVLAADLSDAKTERMCMLCGEFCDDDDPAFAVPFEELMAVFIDSFRFHYRPAVDVLPWDSEDGYLGPVMDTSEAVDDLGSGAFEPECEADVLAAITDAIGFDEEWTTWSAGTDTDDLVYQWERFEAVVKHRSRFVMVHRTGPLSVAHGVARESPMDALGAFLDSVLVYTGRDLGLVRQMPSGSSFFRGRLCERPKDVPVSAVGLGPAPSGKASANRMSPQGISMFYASSDPATAISEIAGHGVEPCAVVAEFLSTRELTVLDLTLTPDPPSPFDDSRRHEARMIHFLSSFVHSITVPVIPDGRQHVDYAPTQVLTEYLRWVSDTQIDGIVLPSAQTNKPTYVMFFDSDSFVDVDTPALVLTPLQQSLGIEPEPPVFTMDPTAVVAYDVHRTYTAKRMSTLGR